MSILKGRSVCPQCNTVLGVREIHTDCLAAIDLKEAIASIASILKEGGISLVKIGAEFKKIKYLNSPKKVIERGLSFYKNIVMQFKKGAFATASAEKVIRPLLNGLEKIGTILRKVRVFQGEKILTL